MTRSANRFTPSKVLLWSTGLYAILLVALSVLNRVGAEVFWLGALNFYLPQIMWAAPGVVLALLYFRLDRRRIWLPLLCLLWVLGPIMDFRWSFPATPDPGRPALRVMTWNIKYGYYDLAPLVMELERGKPDLVLFQDAVGALRGPLADYFKNWQVVSSGQYLIASRYPLTEAKVLPLSPAGHTGGSFMRCRMRVGAAQVAVYNVHLKTPRWSLNEFRAARKRPWRLLQAVQYLHENVAQRLLQASTLQGHLSRERGAVILAGDLNAPESSRVLITLKDAGLRDAFSERGRGYGYTYGHLLLKYRLPWFRVSWMRIDHIMVNAGFETRSCRTGSGEASDHRPVIADLVLKAPSPPQPSP